jgi:hypothetical protein
LKPIKTCKCLDNHKIHRCQLDRSKHSALIDILSNDPKVKCENCGAKANTGVYVCLPVELEMTLAEGG